MMPSRTRQKQELQKQQQELEKKREENDIRKQRDMAGIQSSASVDVPQVPQGPVVSLEASEVPPTILKVQTKLAHPTSYHVTAVQKRQVQQYLTQQGTALQSRSAPSQNTNPLAGRGNFTSMSVQKDPLLSGAMNTSPMKGSPLNPTNGANMGIFGHPIPQAGMWRKPPEDGTGLMMMTDQGQEDSQPLLHPSTPVHPSTSYPQIQDQIIEDIMGLEEKFGDTLGGMPYLESGMMAPQTLHVTSNIFDTFAMGSGAGSPVMMSASCPANVKEDHSMMNPGASIDIKHYEKERQKKNNHNMIERRRRFNINDRIKELGMLLPASESEARQNKGTILKASVDYIRKLQRDMHKMKIQDTKQKQLEESNRQMRLRIQELELTARAHGIPTPSLNPETRKLAEAADQALGSVTPRSKSPGSTSVTPAGFGPNDDLSDILRASPGIDLSRLNIKQEPLESPSPIASNTLSPSPHPPSTSYDHPSHHHHLHSLPQQQRPMGDIFSFNIPLTTSASQLSAAAHNAMDTSLQLFGDT